MCETIVGAIIGAVGALLGVGISFLIEIWRNKREKERVVLELKINTYADAIRYISLCSGIALYEDMPDPSSSKIARELLNEERDLYAHFHPVFTAIAPKGKVEAFNALRNDVSSKKISQEDAYLQVVALLDFNINK